MSDKRLLEDLFFLTDRDMNYTDLVYVKETQRTATHHKGKLFYFSQKRL